MARFAIMGNYLYVVDHSTIKTVRLSEPENPDYLEYKDQVPAGWNRGSDIETIFPDSERELLFIGSRGAMYIYDASNPEFLSKLGTASHITSCDPVVSYGDYAYVTLNSTNGWMCNTQSNVLNIYDIRNLSKPLLKKTVSLRSPLGLGVDGPRERLFVCTNGMTMYNIADPENPVPIDDLQNSVGAIKDGIIETYDVIPMTGKAHLLLVGENGLFQLDYSTDRLTLLDHISVNRRNK